MEIKKEVETSVKVFLPGISYNPYEFEAEPICETQLVLNRICNILEVEEGCLSKRGKIKELATNTLLAGDYDFHIIRRISKHQPGM